MRTLQELQENNNPNSGPRPSLQKLRTTHSAPSHDLKTISQSPNSIIHNIKSPQISYISQAFQNIEKGCVDQQTGQLKIDGHFGDYRMKIFRKKDKLKYLKEPKSIFCNQEFLEKIWSLANGGLNKKQQNEKLKSANTQEINSPNRALRLQRMRPGLKLRSPNPSSIIKEIEQEKQQQYKQMIEQQNLQLVNKINEILSKPNELYLTKPEQKNHQEEQKSKVRKGIEQQLRQKQGHLFFRSIPQYMAEKWFKTLDNSSPDGNYVAPYVQQKTSPPAPKKNHHKKTHIFRFMERSCHFNNKEPFHSVISS